MKLNRKNYLNYAIIILVFGFIYFFLIDYLNYIDFKSQFKDNLLIQFPRPGKYNTIWNKLVTIGFGIISFFLSFQSKALNENKKRIILISVSILLVILSVFIFPNLILQFDF